MDNMGYNLSYEIFCKKVKYAEVSRHSRLAETAWTFVLLMILVELIRVSNKARVASKELETVGCFWGQH